MNKKPSDTEAELRGFPPELEDRYRPERVLGQGGMGRVYLAADRKLGRKVAIKVVPAQLASEQTLRRLEREALILARIKHPNVVEVFDAGVVEIGPYLIAEYLEGMELASIHWRGDPLEPMLGVARGLECLHGHGLLHRDVKPGNIMVTSEGRAVLVDFGLAAAEDLTRFTRTGGVVGTIAYLDPLAMQGRPLDATSDWYAWGASLYHLLEGRLPFERDQIFAWMAVGEVSLTPTFEVLTEEDPRRRLITRAMDLDPAHRPRSEADVLAILKGEETREGASDTRGIAIASRPIADLTEGSPPIGEPAGPPASPRWLLGGLTGIALVAAVVVSITHDSGPSAPPPDAPPPSRTPASSALSPPAGDSPFPADYVARVRRELTEAAGLTLDEAGRVRSDVPQSERNAEFLDPDPAAWGRVVERLPELTIFRDWIRIGGHPEELPEPLRKELAETDRWYADQLLPEPFSPYLDALPGVGIAPPTPEIEKLYERRLRAGMNCPMPPISGWATTAVRAYSRACKLQLAADEDARNYRHSRRLGGVSLGVAGDVVRFGSISTIRLLDISWMRPSARMELREWLREGSRTTRLWLYALARSIEDEPGTRGAMTLLFSPEIHRFRTFLYTSWAFEDPAVVLGGEPSNPWSWLLYARLCRYLGDIRKLVGEDITALIEEERFAWEQASRIPAATPLEWECSADATLELLRHHLRNGSPEAVEGLFRRQRKVASKWRRRRCLGYLRELLEVMVTQRSRYGMDDAGLDELVTDLAGSVDTLHEHEQQNLAKLRELAEKSKPERAGPGESRD